MTIGLDVGARARYIPKWYSLYWRQTLDWQHRYKNLCCSNSILLHLLYLEYKASFGCMTSTGRWHGVILDIHTLTIAIGPGVASI